MCFLFQGQSIINFIAVRPLTCGNTVVVYQTEGVLATDHGFKISFSITCSTLNLDRYGRLAQNKQTQQKNAFFKVVMGPRNWPKTLQNAQIPKNAGFDSCWPIFWPHCNFKSCGFLLSLFVLCGHFGYNIPVFLKNFGSPLWLCDFKFANPKM